MNKYPSERLFCLTIVLTVDKKWFTARIKPPQVRIIPVADGMSEDTGRFRLQASEVLPVLKSCFLAPLEAREQHEQPIKLTGTQNERLESRLRSHVDSHASQLVVDRRNSGS